MKKLLGTTLALAMFVPAGANAELLKNFKIGGNLDIQTTSARNVTDFVTHGAGNNDRIVHANARLIVKTDWDLLDDVHAHATLAKGVQGGITVQERATYSPVQEANVKIDKVFGALDVTAGRQFYGEEGDLVIYYGPRDNYGLTVSAVDMFRADWNGEHMSVTAIAGKTADGVITSSGNVTATDLRGIIVTCKMPEMVKSSLYVYNQLTHTAGQLGAPTGKDDNLWVAGLKAKVATGGLTASAEFAKNFGRNRPAVGSADPSYANYKGYAIQLKAGYKLDLSGAGMINPWGEYGMGTGDSNFNYKGNNTFQAINSDYRPGGIYGRFDNGAAIALGGATYGASSNGLSNRIIWGFGVKASPAALNKLTVGAQFYRYAFHRVAPNAAGSKTSRNIGTEVDVTGEWKHSENVSFKATAGSFKPGAYIADNKGAGAALNPVVMLAGDVAIKF